MIGTSNLNEPFVPAIYEIAQKVRNAMEEKHGEDTLYGSCIEASELLVAEFERMGLHARTVEGWCAWDEESYGSSRPYDEHTWCEVSLPGGRYPNHSRCDHQPVRWRI